MAGSPGMEHVHKPIIPQDPGQDRALASDAQEPPYPARALLPAGDLRTQDHRLHQRPDSIPTMRASTISTRLTSTSDAPAILERKRIKHQEQSQTVACSINFMHIISITDDPEPPFRKPAICLKSSDDGQAWPAPPSDFGDVLAVQNSLALKLAMDLARILNLLEGSRYPPEEQDKACIPVLAALLQNPSRTVWSTRLQIGFRALRTLAPSATRLPRSSKRA